MFFAFSEVFEILSEICPKKNRAKFLRPNLFLQVLYAKRLPFRSEMVLDEQGFDSDNFMGSTELML